MTPRKELFIKIKQALETIPELELVDLDRAQFNQEDFPNLFVAAMISIEKIEYETMTQQIQEGKTAVKVTLYCRDGWRNQHNGTADPEHGLIEIDLLDAIAEKLQFLKGDQFKPLQQTEDNAEDVEMKGMFAFSQTFDTRIFRQVGSVYNTKTITH